MQELVSIISPCYNGELYIARFLDSILAQTYGNIELIIIDDGSTDNTAEIIQSYSSKFESKNYSLIYKYQSNAGQSAALNVGLQIFNGKYLTWPDSDDFLSTDAITLRVKYLLEHPKFGFVRSDAAFYDEDNLEEYKYLATDNVKDKFKQKLFDSLVFENNAYVCNGAYLVKSDSFLTVNPDRKIYNSQGGQNWQMLLPLAFNFLCGYIDEPLYSIVIRKNSHSRNKDTLEDKLIRCDVHQDILINVIKDLAVDQATYKAKIKNKYDVKKFQLAFDANNIEATNLYFRKLEKPNIKEKLKLLIIKYRVMHLVYRWYRDGF